MSVDYNPYLPRNVLAVQSTLVNKECLTKDISYKNVVNGLWWHLNGTKGRYQSVLTPNLGVMADQGRGCGVPCRGVQEAGAKIGGWQIQQGAADSFRHRFPARPRIEEPKASLRFGQTRLPEPSQ